MNRPAESRVSRHDEIECHLILRHFETAGAEILRAKQISGAMANEIKSTQSTAPSTACETDELDAGNRKRQHQSSASYKLSDRAEIVHGRRGGPATERGKKRSSQNAIIHGIFSEASLLKGEYSTQLESLIRGFREAARPDGMLEALLVDKLASIAWRYRRCLRAETAEIRNSTEFLILDRRDQQKREAETIMKGEIGLVRRIDNPVVLENCVGLLINLCQKIECEGLEPNDVGVLQRVYGEHFGGILWENYQTYLKLWHSWNELPLDYVPWTQGTCEEELDYVDGYAAEKLAAARPEVEQCKQKILEGIESEIRRLKQLLRKSISVDSRRAKVEILSRNVPDLSRLDRLLRYEASLERAFDRTLNQLERLQRLRLGQPVAPRLEVSVS